MLLHGCGIAYSIVLKNKVAESKRVSPVGECAEKLDLDLIVFFPQASVVKTSVALTDCKATVRNSALHLIFTKEEPI